MARRGAQLVKALKPAPSHLKQPIGAWCWRRSGHPTNCLVPIRDVRESVVFKNSSDFPRNLSPKSSQYLSEMKQTTAGHNLQKSKMEDKYMKSSLIKITKAAVALIAIVAAGGLLAGAFHSETASAQNAGNQPPPFVCNNAALDGDYAFRVSGETFVASGSTTIAQYRDGVAMTHFDGNGGLDQVDFIMVNGKQIPPTGSFNEESGGTYKVNPVTLNDGSSACTGTFTIYPGGIGEIDVMFVLGDRGKVIHTIVYKSIAPDGTTLYPNIHSDAEKL
jgi:hypothetical protein